MFIMCRTVYFQTRERSFGGKYQIFPNTAYFDAVTYTIQITYNFLEVGAWEIDYSGINNVRYHQLLQIGFDEAQFLTVTLADCPIFILEPQITDNPLVVVGIFYIYRESVVVGNRAYHAEQMECIGTYHYFLGFANIIFELIGFEKDVY
jgi:hypothetical protein